MHVAYRQACLNAIEYLKKFGYSGAQAYSILGTAPVQGHISGVVDIPNACATLWLPTEIFDFDINPSAGRADRSSSTADPDAAVAGPVSACARCRPTTTPCAALRRLRRAMRSRCRSTNTLRRLRPVHRHAADGGMRRAA